ncbi:receptor-interacting serine/threonine-protein kinase 4-like [Conger conger]|uniref:receptor-interacting serine/threonine-protein kinase 4-like n=1 Tax=Conger conger TaxID=82655 RepID=UPI002A5AB079|nr:receptor-interacting serine/threonine-protein kinase 4-like [Conger conger]
MQHFGLLEDCKLQDWSVIGSGGFGQIYKAKHKDLGMEVAIKLLHYDDGSSASLQKEAEFMQQGGSLYVVRVFGAYRGVPPGRERSSQMGLVMELMERGSVESLLKRLRGPPPWPLAFRLAHEVALGMNFLHKLRPPLLHLDLKPNNVLLDHGFRAKITDFGLARLMRSISSVGGRGEGGGTLSYMPPEAFRTPYKATAGSDSYSYAILLWSIITGREPYGDVWSCRIRFQVLEGYRPSLEGVNRAAVEGLGEIIDLMERCWDPSPQKRPSFHDCLPVTEKVFELHSRGIHDAIHQVSKALDEREISPTPIPKEPCAPGRVEATDVKSSSVSLCWERPVSMEGVSYEIHIKYSYATPHLTHSDRTTLPPIITPYQVSGELRRRRPRKAAGPDRVCPRLLKACAVELGEPLQHVFNLSLRLGKVPAMWKTSCLIPVPKKPHPSQLNNYRPVALTSHMMKTMERLLLNILRPQVRHALDPLQIAYQVKVGVEHAIIYLLHRTHSHLDKGKDAVRIMFFDFSSAFNTIQPG